MCLGFGRKAFKSLFFDHEKLHQSQSMGILCEKGSPSTQLAFMALIPNMFFSCSCNMCTHTHVTVLALHPEQNNYQVMLESSAFCLKYSSYFPFFTYVFLSLTLLALRLCICLPIDLQLQYLNHTDSVIDSLNTQPTKQHCLIQ